MGWAIFSQTHRVTLVKRLKTIAAVVVDNDCCHPLGSCNHANWPRSFAASHSQGDPMSVLKIAQNASHSFFQN
jgi:hypothetical protein